MDKSNARAGLVMREPFFNDISDKPLCNTDEELKERVLKYARVLEFCGSLGYKKVRYEKHIKDIELKPNYSLHQYIAEHGKDSDAQLILNMVRIPYLDEDSPEEEKYVNTIVKLKREGTEMEAEGLACTYLSDGFSIGLSSCDFWTNHHLL